MHFGWGLCSWKEGGGGGGGSAKPSKKLTLMMCSNCTNFTLPFAQYLHHLMLCQCVEGNVKSTELSLKVVFICLHLLYSLGNSVGLSD